MTLETYGTASFGSDGDLSSLLDAKRNEPGVQIAQVLVDPVPLDVGTNAGRASPVDFPARVTADANNVVHLPQGVSINQLRVDGNDLLLVQPGGSIIKIVDGALGVPSLVVGYVEFGAEVLVTALEAAGIDVAAGPDGTFAVAVAGVSSNGSDFSQDIPARIDDAGPAINLLSSTDIVLGQLVDDELISAAIKGPDFGEFVLLPGPDEEAPEGHSGDSDLIAKLGISANKIVVFERALGTDPDENDPREGGAIGTAAASSSEMMSGAIALSTGTSHVADIYFLPVSHANYKKPTVTTQTGAAVEIDWTINGLGQMVGSHGGVDVLLIEISAALPVPPSTTAPVEIRVTLLTPLTHDVQDVDYVVIDGVQIGATDANGLSAGGSFGIAVVDDVPMIDPGLAISGEMRLDETVGLRAGDDNSDDELRDSPPPLIAVAQPLIGHASLIVEGLRNNGSFAGADGLGSESYSLTVIDGGNSGLFDTATGNEIILRKLEPNPDSPNIEIVAGYVGDSQIPSFVIQMDHDNDSFSVWQYRALRHDNAGDADDTDALLAFPDGVLTLAYTITDGDGDSAITLLDLGSIIVFEDDGPTLVSTATLQPGGFSYAVTEGAQIRLDLTNASVAGTYQNSYGYYFEDAEGQPLSGTVIWGNAGQRGGSQHSFEIDVPTGAVTLGFFLIPDGARQNALIANGDKVTFEFDDDTELWTAIGENGLLQGSGGADILFSNPLLNPGFDQQVVDNATAGTHNWEDMAGRGDESFNDLNVTVRVPATTIRLTANEDGLKKHKSDNAAPDDGAGGSSAIIIGAPGALMEFVDFGSDGAHASEAFSIKVLTSPVDTQLRSRGEKVLVTSVDGKLVGYVDDDGDGGYQAATERPIFTLEVSGDGSYRFELHGQIDHPSLDGVADDNTANLLTTPLDLSSYIFGNDGDGDGVALGVGTFVIQVLDDVAQVQISGEQSSVLEDRAISGAWSFDGADGISSVMVTVGDDQQPLSFANPSEDVTFALANGTLTVSADFTWKFAAKAVQSDQIVTFFITVTDGDGDVTTAEQTFTVLDLDGPLRLQSISLGTVEEEHGLAERTEDTAGAGDLDTEDDPNVTTNVVEGNFLCAVEAVAEYVDTQPTFAFTALNGNPLVQLADGGSLRSGGALVRFAIDNEELIGYVKTSSGGSAYVSGADTKVFTLALDGSSGKYTFTLLRPIDHPDRGDNIEGSAAIDLNGRVTVTTDDDTGSPSSKLIEASVNIIDDTPVAVGSGIEVQPAARPSVNIVLMIDHSYSMTTRSALTPSRLDEAKEIAIKLLQTSDVEYKSILVVGFDGTAKILGDDWLTVDEAIAQIEGITASGPPDNNTNYNAALQAVMDAWDQNEPGAATETLSYFISDSYPAAAGGRIDAYAEQRWIDFLINNDVNASYGVNVSRAITASNSVNLEPITWANGSSDVRQFLVRSVDEIVPLMNTLPATASGNMLTDGAALGADGGHVASITFGGAVFNHSAATKQIVIDSNNVSGFVGKLVFHLEANGTKQTGDWDYYSPSDGGGPIEFTLSYTLVDRDGDQATGTHTIRVVPQQNMVAAEPVNQVAAFIEPDDDGHLIGTEGDDVLVGGEGVQYLTGGSGADTFRFDEHGTGMADFITDYDHAGGAGDVIELGSLLSTVFGSDAGRLRLTEASDHINLQIDTDGTGAWSNVATLIGQNTMNVPDPVKVLYGDGQEITLTV